MLLVALTCYVCFALKASKLPVFIDFINIQWIIFMDYIIVYKYIFQEYEEPVYSYSTLSR